jgi:hypothetical protein
MNYVLTSTAVSCPTCCDACINLNVTGGCPPYSYIWSPNDPNVPALCSACAGVTYTVIMTDSCGCSKQSLITPDTAAIIVGITEQTAQALPAYQIRDGIIVFIKPVKDLKVFDMLGNLQFSLSGYEFSQATLPELKTGLYIMKVVTEDGEVWTEKVVGNW